MAGLGKTAGDEEGGIVTEMQAVGCGVGAYIKGHTAGVKLVDKIFGGNVLNKASPFEFFV